jgi:hypothetical protein
VTLSARGCTHRSFHAARGWAREHRARSPRQLPPAVASAAAFAVRRLISANKAEFIQPTFLVRHGPLRPMPAHGVGGCAGTTRKAHARREHQGGRVDREIYTRLRRIRGGSCGPALATRGRGPPAARDGGARLCSGLECHAAGGRRRLLMRECQDEPSATLLHTVRISRSARRTVSS